MRVVWRPPREAVALAPPPLPAGEQGRGWEENVVLGLLDDDLARFTRGVEASGRRVHTLALYQDAAHKPADVADPQAFYRLADTTSGTRLSAHGARPGDTALDLARKLVGRDRFVSLLTRLQGEARPLALEIHVAPLLRAPPALPPLAQLASLATQLIARGAVAALVDLGGGGGGSLR